MMSSQTDMMSVLQTLCQISENSMPAVSMIECSRMWDVTLIERSAALRYTVKRSASHTHRGQTSWSGSVCYNRRSPGAPDKENV
jgi:hypothetical protein